MTELKRKAPLARVGKKPGKCRQCGESFTRERTGQFVCGTACGVAHAMAKSLRQDRKENRERKRELKKNDLRHQLALCQTAVNAWVRWRDRDKPCVTCGAPPGINKQGGTRDAGHYLSRGAYPVIRFDIRQVHAQCVRCNRYNSGLRHEYRLAMIDMHGLELVEWFEAQTHAPKWDVDEVREIAAEYRRRLRDEQRAAA